MNEIMLVKGRFAPAYPDKSAPQNDRQKKRDGMAPVALQLLNSLVQG